MEKINKDQEIVSLTRSLLNMKEEKKQYNKDMNENIKEIEGQIKILCKEK